MSHLLQALSFPVVLLVVLQSGRGNAQPGSLPGSLEVVSIFSQAENVREEGVTIGDRGESAALVLTSREDRRVFAKDDAVILCVVLLNTSEQVISVPERAVELSVEGSRSGISKILTNPSAARIRAHSTRCLEFRLGQVNPIWRSGGFSFVGDRFTATAGGKSFTFIVDEFGVPEWLRTSNVVGLGPFGAGHKERRFRLYDPEFYEKVIYDIHRAGIGAVFIGPEFFSYGVLEGGGWYKDKSGNDLQEPHLHYWFPTGPPRDGVDEYTYLTPPHRGDGTQLSADDIREFVSFCHKGPQSPGHGDLRWVDPIRVIGYTDWWGIYDPDEKVRSREAASVVLGSTRSLPDSRLSDPNWVRIKDGSPIRVDFIDNILSEVPIRRSGIGFTYCVRELNPENYAVSPALYPASDPFLSPAPGSATRIVSSSDYRSYVASQMGVLTGPSGYDLDGVFNDDLGRIAQDTCNISIPLCDLGGDPCLFYTCPATDFRSGCGCLEQSHEVIRVVRQMASYGMLSSHPGLTGAAAAALLLTDRLALKLLVRELFHPLCNDHKSDCGSQYLFGCSPLQSLYLTGGLEFPSSASTPGERNTFLRAASGQFLRYCRSYIKEWGGNDRVLISSDYYVPPDEVAFSADGSSTDLYDLFDEYQARWCDETRKRYFKPTRLDYNPRTNTSSEDLQVAMAAVAWANGSVFWFGGDKAGLPLNGILTSIAPADPGADSDLTAFSTSRYGRYARFHRQLSDWITNPLLELKYHSDLPGTYNQVGAWFDHSDSPMIGRARPGGRYVTMFDKPSAQGTQYRIVHLIDPSHAYPDGPLTIHMDLPPGLTAVRVQQFMADQEGLQIDPTAPFSPTEFVLDDPTEADTPISLAPGHYRAGLLPWISLAIDDIGTYSVIIIEFGPEHVASPTIVGTIPDSDARNVSTRTSGIVAFFDMDMDSETINSESFVVSDEGIPIEGEVSFVPEFKEALFVPKAVLEPGRTYRAVVTSGVASARGNHMPSDYSWRFSTQEAAGEGRELLGLAMYSRAFSQVGGTDLSGDYVVSMVCRNRWTYGGHWADLSSGGQSAFMRSFGAQVGYMVAGDDALPISMPYAPLSYYGFSLYGIVSLKRLEASQPNHGRWECSSVAGQPCVFKHEPLNEDLLTAGLGVATMAINERRILYSSFSAYPSSGGRWTYDLESVSTYRILPWVSLGITCFLTHLPHEVYGGVGIGIGVNY